MNGTVNIRKTNCVIQWIEIYPMNSIIHSYNQGQHIVVLNNMGLDSMLLLHWIKIFPDLASTRFRIHSVLKSFHSGERIKKKCGFVCRIHRIRVDGGRIRKEKAVGFNNIRIRVDEA